MSGNVHEWTSDWSDESKTRQTVRSASWMNAPGGFFLSSARTFPAAVSNGDTVGLRAVLDLNLEANEKPALPVAASPPSNPLPVEPASDPAEATTESPYENSLGMRFAPVPITGGPSDGKLILFSIWEARVSDYRAFTDSNPQIKLRNIPFAEDDSHSAIGISYDYAVAFCEWLTRSETEKGNLADGQHYRLPTDHEWSCAVGIGEMEDPVATPASKDKALERHFPWGDTWPPPNGAANWYGEENAGLGLFGEPRDHMENYTDGYRFTAPVDSMEVGRFGLYHTAGNASEWTSDWSDETRALRTTRSLGWSFIPNISIMSSRGRTPTNANNYALGFRAVLDLNRDAPEPGTSTAAEKMPANAPETADQETTGAMDTAPASPLASVPGLEPRLTAYLQFRQKLIGDLSEKYLGALQGRFDAAIASGDLALAKAFESEKASVEALRSSLVELDQDPFASISSSSTLNPLPEGTPPGLSELRTIWIGEREKISTQLSSNLVQSLHALEVELTKAADLENATKVSEFKASIELKPPPSPQASPDAPVLPSPKATPSIEPFENSLGMKFVPIPVSGSTILLCIHETTVENYRKFLRDNRDRSWPEPTYRLRDQHAATLMTWLDATAFCEWLTEKERRNGTISEQDSYTLPSLLELQTAVGIVGSHDSTTGRTSYARKYLWGDDWPIPRVVGNLFGEETVGEVNSNRPPITGYNDGEPQVAEVGSYEPNEFGIYDLIGNVWEYCSDWFNDDEVSRVVFGSAWQSNEERTLRAGFRSFAEPAMRSTVNGFRVVLRRSPES